MKDAPLSIQVGSRASPLARVQVKEVLDALQKIAPHVQFDTSYLESTGDLDKKTSLRALDKTDFFTKEIDEMLLSSRCRIGIHSAKDLPEPLPKGLTLLALTKGVDPSDSLVMHEGVTLETLPKGAIIATSSIRRESLVSSLVPGFPFTFVDVRGTIAERLALLDQKKVDGVVIAEAALIRLGLTHLNRIKLPGETSLYQGQLAIVGLEGDQEMLELFRPLDGRPYSLYTGLEIADAFCMKRLFHCPLISIKPQDFHEPSIKKVFGQLAVYTHIIFTSKTAVTLFFDYAKTYEIPLAELCKKRFIAVGKATARLIQSFGVECVDVAKEETAEGVCVLLRNYPLVETGARVLWPHALRARSVITDFLKIHHITYDECILYDTSLIKPKIVPDLNVFDEIIFTSPSTIESFKELYGFLPKDKKLITIGPVTASFL